MSTVAMTSETAVLASETETGGFKLEVVVLPVSDVDRAKRFYASLGWREDADFPISEGFRVVQMTPPGSPTSIIFGSGVAAAEPGAVESLVLAVHDIDAARDELIARGADVSEVFHGSAYERDGTRLSGPDPERRSYSSWASFSDPDGNGWLLQEIKTRLPGRADTDIAALANLLHETEGHHGPYEMSSPPHHWWDWYAAYVAARQGGNTEEEAVTSAARYMEEVLDNAPR